MQTRPARRCAGTPRMRDDCCSRGVRRPPVFGGTRPGRSSPGGEVPFPGPAFRPPGLCRSCARPGRAPAPAQPRPPVSLASSHPRTFSGGGTPAPAGCEPHRGLLLCRHHPVVVLANLPKHSCQPGRCGSGGLVEPDHPGRRARASTEFGDADGAGPDPWPPLLAAPLDGRRVPSGHLPRLARCDRGHRRAGRAGVDPSTGCRCGAERGCEGADRLCALGSAARLRVPVRHAGFRAARRST